MSSPFNPELNLDLHFVLKFVFVRISRNNLCGTISNQSFEDNSPLQKNRRWARLGERAGVGTGGGVGQVGAGLEGEVG